MGQGRIIILGHLMVVTIRQIPELEIFVSGMCGTVRRSQDLDKLIVSLVPKFGMEAFPDNRTIASYLRDATLDADMYHQSSTLNFHHKAVRVGG